MKLAVPLLWLICVAGLAQTRQPVCDRGVGHFEASLATGVTVRVGAVVSGGFATRTCEAVLRWGNERVVVVPTAAQVDIDVLGADLGLGVPVVAFVVKPAADGWQSSYQIWSVEKQPRLLRTLTGSDTYRAVDLDFDRQVVISATDALAVENFEGFRLANYTSPPTVVLRFESGRLLDVSARYPTLYDRQIAILRSTLTTEAMADFRQSDGLLKPGSLPLAEWLRLRETNATVLQIVWAYLYSGRSERAWAELDAAWPRGDVSRIKAAILTARAQGIETQVAKTVPPARSRKLAQRPFLYEYLKPNTAPEEPVGRPMYGIPGVTGREGPVLLQDQRSSELYAADTEPQAISLWRPPPTAAEQHLAGTVETVLLTIDEAGKVQAAKMLVPHSDSGLLEAAKHWKFIPASRRKKPVAYQLKMDVQPLR